LRRTGPILAVLAAWILAATACGSTVPASRALATAPTGGQGTSNGGGGLSVPTGTTTGGGGTGGSFQGTGGGSTGGGTTVGVTSGDGTHRGVGTGGTTGGGGTNTGGGSNGGTLHASAPGITPTKIYLGALYLKNQAAANAAVGAAGAGGTDGRDAYRAVIDEVNRHGGIAGREVVPVFAPLDVTSATPVDEQEQAACSTWTEDNTVFAILWGGRDIVEECAREAGVVELWSSVVGGASVPETFRRYPNYVELIGMNLVRTGSVTVDGLATQGYFGKDAKIGMLTWDEPPYREGLQQGYIPALRRHGLELATAPVYLTPPQTIQDLSATSSQMNSAVLTFSTLGIDHVMMLDGSAGLCGVGCMGTLFMRRAQSQQYYPRYGFNDNNGPVAGQQAGFYPDDQLRRSMSVGWTDLDKSYDQGWHINGVRERCYTLMRKHGVGLADVNSEAAALEACDELWFLQTAVGKMGGADLTVDNLIATINGLGSSFDSTGAYGTNLSLAQHDGAAKVRNLRFMDSCTCFRYTSRPYTPG
jgi:hypothetical protein